MASILVLRWLVRRCRLVCLFALTHCTTSLMIIFFASASWNYRLKIREENKWLFLIYWHLTPDSSVLFALLRILTFWCSRSSSSRLVAILHPNIPIPRMMKRHWAPIIFMSRYAIFATGLENLVHWSNTIRHVSSSYRPAFSSGMLTALASLCDCSAITLPRNNIIQSKLYLIIFTPLLSMMILDDESYPGQTDADKLNYLPFMQLWYQRFLPWLWLNLFVGSPANRLWSRQGGLSSAQIVNFTVQAPSQHCKGKHTVHHDAPWRSAASTQQPLLWWSDTIKTSICQSFTATMITVMPDSTSIYPSLLWSRCDTEADAWNRRRHMGDPSRLLCERQHASLALTK